MISPSDGVSGSPSHLSSGQVAQWTLSHPA
jgi:hypothetical protein